MMRINRITPMIYPGLQKDRDRGTSGPKEGFVFRKDWVKG